MKKLLLKSSGEKVDDEKRIDLLFQALDKLKEAEIMVSQHILTDYDTFVSHTITDTYTNINNITHTNTITNTNTNTKPKSW